MLESSQSSLVPSASDLRIQWEPSCALVNLRIHALDAPLREALETAQVALPQAANTTAAHGSTRCIWAGPDDWFVRDESIAAINTHQLQQRLQTPLAHTHHAITDVSSGYRVLSLRGAAAREVLAQGCPLDLHASQFKVSMSAGTHFFKASVWLWQTDGQTDEQPSYQMLVRRSFAAYVHLMLQKATLEHGGLPDYAAEEA